MTVKEITTLRKSGQLKEALEAAEIEFAQSANKYTVGALFWCLNDLYKQQNSNDASATIARMKTLYNDYSAGDEYMFWALASADRQSLPHFHQIKNAVEAARGGADAISAHQQATAWFNDGQIDRQLYSDFGWLTYYALKQTAVGDARKRKVLLNQYLKLDLPKPSILHSLILSEAIKVEQDTPLQFRIRDFIRLWGLDNLRDDDWEQFKTDDGKTMSSLVEKLISVYAKELKTDNVAAASDFHDLVNRALIKYPSNQYMPFYKAIVLKSLGHNEEALDYYKKLILKSPSKWFLWHQASALLNDIDLKIALLSKAISVEKDESFVGGCRLNLAKALIERGLFSQAQEEQRKYHEFYTSNGWSLKQEYQAILSQIPNGTIPEDNQQLYKEKIQVAEDFIYSALPSVFAIKLEDKQIEDRFHPGRKFIQWTIRTKSGLFKLKKPSKFGLNGRVKNGTPLELKIQDKRIVWIKMSNQNPLQQDWIKKFEGFIRLRKDKNKNDYALIEGVYIGNRLLKGISDGDAVKVIAIKQEDGRWIAISNSKI